MDIEILAKHMIAADDALTALTVIALILGAVSCITVWAFQRD